MIVETISAVLFIGYALLITAITVGWWRLKVFNSTDVIPEAKVSVIVAVRNEALNIEPMLKSLLAQNYPSHLYEIIIVDDHSTDSTTRLVQDYIVRKRENQNLKLFNLGGKNGSGKKAAIDHGIKSSEGDFIIITDADCTAGSQWVSTIASYFTVQKPMMILGPVRMTNTGSFFGKLQSLEFMSLISSAAGSCAAGFPILANGANIAFTRHAYESCGGFSGNMQFSSGDDIFLMMNIKRKFGTKAIRFLRSEEGIVNTPVTTGFKVFIHQRLRWVSKSRGYTDPMLILASILVFLSNSWMVFISVLSIGFPEYFKLVIVFYLLKMIVDFPLMISFAHFQKCKKLLWLIPILELVNAVYTLLIGIAGNIGRYEWKGRRGSNNGVERG